MKKRFARCISLLLSILLAFEGVPQSTGSLYQAFAAEKSSVLEPAVNEDAANDTASNAAAGSKTDEEDPPLSDEDVARWMEETGLGSGRLIIGDPSDNEDIKDEALNFEEHILYRANISIDGDGGSEMRLQDAFNKAQNESKEKVPVIKLKYNMFIDEPITIKKGKTVHLFLNGMDLYRSPKGSGKDNQYYIMDESESDGNLFILEEDAKLIITGGKKMKNTASRYEQKGVPYRESEKNYSYSTARLVGGYNSGKGGAIYAAAKSTVDLRNLTIANCAAKYGGAVYAESQANIQLANTKITCNFAKSDGGAAYLNGAKGVLNMDNDTKLVSNRAGDLGGAICLDSEKIIVCGAGKTEIDGNLASGDGGAIYLPSNDNNYIRGIRFLNNISQKEGGAIYANGKGASIGDSVFENNYARQGGGIYINAKNCGISSVTMTRNLSEKQGGAIWVDSMDDLGVSGTVVIKDNYSGKNHTQDNIALQNGFTSTAYLEVGGNLGAGSEVWVHDSNIKNRRLSSQPGSYDARQFKVDGGTQHVEFKSDRQLYIADGAPGDSEKDSKKASVSEVNYSEWKTRDITKASSEAEGKTDYKYTASDGAEYPVYYGYLSSPSHTTETTDIVSKYYYSDGFFFSDPKKYDNHLATFGLQVARAGFESYIKTQSDYRYKFTNIKSLLQQIGIEEDDIYINDWYTKKPAEDSIGVAIGKKTIKNSKGESYTLVPIAVRGDGYEKEWAGNVTINGSNTDDMKDEHSGFKSARSHVMDEITYYVKSHGLKEDLDKGKVKFFIAGYSRGSATANLTGKCLVDTYGENSGYKNKNQVFAYCYEVPSGGTDYRDNSKAADKNNECYYCIHNIVNKVDLVPFLAPYEMGFKRYGVDHYIPGDPNVKASPVATDKPAEIKDKVDNVTCYYDNDPWYVGSDSYNRQKEKMVKQLLAVNEEMDFNDYFKEYYITMGKANFVKNFEAYTFHKSKSGKKLEYWLPEFYSKFFSWNLISSDKNLTRESFSNYIMREGEAGKGWYESGVAPQDAFRGMTKIMFSKTPEETKNLTLALTGVLNKFNSPVFGSGNTLLTLYSDLIGDDKGWDKSRAIQQKWLDELWSKLTDNRYGQKGIQDVMSPSELKDFKSYFPALMGIVFRMLKYDYDNAGSIDKSTQEEMWIAGTFAKNSDTIIKGHMPEIALAWLRSYDGFYDNDLKKIAYTGTGASDTVTPKVMKKLEDGQFAEITENETLNGSGQKVYLQGGKGDAIFYTLEKNGSTNAAKLYNGQGIDISDEGSYKLTAYAIGDYAELASKANGDKYWSKNWKESEKVSKSFRLVTVADREVYYKEKVNHDFKQYKAKQGSAFECLAACQYEGRPFLTWQITEDKEGKTAYKNADYGITEEALKKKKLEIKIPDRTVYIQPVYAPKTVSIESIELNKPEIGKPLPKSIISLTYKNEGSEEVISYLHPEDIKVSWDEVVTSESGTKNRYPIMPGTIVKKDADYIAEIGIKASVNGALSFSPLEPVKVNAVIPGYEYDSQQEQVSGDYYRRIFFKVTEKTQGEEPVTPQPAGNKIHLKRTLLNAEETERAAFEKAVEDRYGRDGLYITAVKDQTVNIESLDVLSNDEAGAYIPVGFKVIPKDLKLYDEYGDEIEIKTWENDGSILSGESVIEDNEVSFKMPESEFTLEAVFAKTCTVKKIDLVLSEPETGCPLNPVPEEAKIRVSLNGQDKEYTLDTASGITIEYTPSGDEEGALGLTSYIGDVSLRFDSLKDKESNKTLQELLGYSYYGIRYQSDDIALTVKNDEGVDIETDMAGLFYAEGEEGTYEEWYVSGYAFEANFEETLPACIITVYDEAKWLTSKKDEQGEKIILEEQSDDGFNGKRNADANWEGLNKLLPETVSVITDDDSEDSIPVIWERPKDTEFRENVIGTQSFTVEGKAQVPEDLFVWNEDEEVGERKDTLLVLCDVTIEAYETAKKPVAMPGGSTYYSNVSVTLSSETEGAKIWYTLDGSEPLDASGKPVSSAKSYDDTKVKSGEGYEAEPGIYIDTPGDTVIKAVSVKDGFDSSETMTERYTIVTKPEAELPEEDFEILDSLFLEEGMCLDDLTEELPDGWYWHELQDINTEYRLEDLIEDEESENNMYHNVTALLKYNPDPDKYEDAVVEISIPLFGELYSVDVIDGEACDFTGEAVYDAEKGETVYLVADYPMEMLESYEFVKWVAYDSAGNTVDVKMAEEEEADYYPDSLKDEETGNFFDGAASFVMPESDVVIKGVFKRYDETEENPQEIKEKSVSSLTLDKETLSLKAGDETRGSGTVKATVSFEGEGKEPSLSFKCSDTNIVRMTTNGNKATLTALKGGYATIWAACGDKIAKCIVNVEPGPLDAVNITVKNGKAVNNAGAEVTKALKGEELILKANAAPEGYRFKKWEIKGASSISGDTASAEAEIKITVGTRDITAEVIYEADNSKGIEIIYDDGYEDSLIDLKAGEKLALYASLLPESSVKQVAQVKYKILSKCDLTKLNSPLKDEIDDYPELKALNGKKLPGIVSPGNGLLTAKWDKNLTKANKTSGMTILRVTMKLVKEKGEKKAVEYVRDYPVRVSATEYESKTLKNLALDKSYSLSAKSSLTTLDMGITGKEAAEITATLSKASRKDGVKLQFTSTNENILSIEEAEETAAPDANKKAYAKAKLKAKGIGTAYVVVKSIDKENEALVNQRIIKITVKSSNPSIVLKGDSASLLPLDENGKVKLEADNSVTINMSQGSYDRFFTELDPGQSTDATKLKFSASGGVTVKNGVVYANKATKDGKPAKVIIKCAKSRPVTILINVK